MEHGGCRVRHEQNAVAEMHRLTQWMAGLQDSLDALNDDDQGGATPAVVPIDQHSEAG